MLLEETVMSSQHYPRSLILLGFQKWNHRKEKEKGHRRTHGHGGKRSSHASFSEHSWKVLYSMQFPTSYKLN